MKDIQGREYAKVSEVKPGTVLTSDGDFDCVEKGTKLIVHVDTDGEFYFHCSSGHHSLDSQLEDDYYIGLYLE